MLPLYFTISATALIDDDSTFISTVELTVVAPGRVTFHTHPGTFERLLERASAGLRHEQQAFFSCVDAQVLGRGDAITRLLRYLATPVRFELTGVAVSDYHMPAVDGLTLLARHSEPGLQRVLLTGVADNVVAIKAFNAGQIDAYVPKQHPDLLRILNSTLRDHMAKSAEARGQILARALSLRVAAQLRDAAVVAKLQSLLAGLQVKEYVALGRPAGLLALTADHRVLWIQLDDEQSFQEQLQALGDLEKAQCAFDLAQAAARISAHAAATDAQSDLPTPQARLEPTRVLQEQPLLCASVFELADLPPELRPQFHDEWLATAEGS